MPETAQKLAAIMFTDIAGYTALMDEDEDRAFDLLERNRKLHKKYIEEYNGQWLKEMGDGILVSFNTITDAVYCARAIMEEVRKDPELALRIGIHEGEVTFRENDVFGSGVNIASRIEQLAPPGSIWVSEAVKNNISNKRGIETDFIGERRLRHLQDPMKIFSVRTSLTETTKTRKPLISTIWNKKGSRYFLMAIIIMALLGGSWWFGLSINTMPVDKSVAILPFRNLKEDPSIAYFVDGLNSDLVNNLSRISELRVVPQLSVEKYREEHLAPADIAKELKVAHLVYADVDKSEGRTRLNIQLIHAREDRQVWGESYEEQNLELLEIGSTIASKIAENLGLDLVGPAAEIFGRLTKSTSEAHDYIKRGDYYLNKTIGDSNMVKEALKMYEIAVEKEPGYALAWVNLGNAKRKLFQFSRKKTEEEKASVKAAFDEALRLDPDLLESKMGPALYYYSCERDFRRAIEHLEPLSDDYPNNYAVLWQLALCYRRSGEISKAESIMARIVELNPSYWNVWYSYGNTLLLARKYDQAIEAMKTSLSLDPEQPNSWWQLAWYHFLRDGDLDEVRKILLEGSQYPQYYFTLYERDYETAKRLARENESPQSYLMLGMTYYLMRNDSSKLFYAKFLENTQDTSPNSVDINPWIQMDRAQAFAGVGKYQLAIETGEQVLEIINPETNLIDGVTFINRLINIYIMCGEHNKAIEALYQLFELSGYYSSYPIKVHPIFDPLREIPEFNDLLEDPKYQVPQP